MRAEEGGNSSRRVVWGKRRGRERAREGVEPSRLATPALREAARRAAVAQRRWIPVGTAEIRDQTQSGLVSAHQAARQCFQRYLWQSVNGWKVKDTEFESWYISQNICYN